MRSILTVITPATNRRLTEVDTVKAVLGVTGATDDTLIGTLIDQMSAAAESYCNRVFAKETIEETFRHLAGLDFIILRRRPVVDIASITVDGVALEETQYEVDAEAGFLYRLDGSDCRVRWCASKVVISYDGGYVPPGDEGRTLPQDLEAGVIELIKVSYLSRKRDPGLKREFVPGVIDYEYFQADATVGSLPTAATDKLDPYRDIRV